MAASKAKELNAVTIYDASTDEIRLFAKEKAGLDFEESSSREYMIDQIVQTLGYERKDPTQDATHVELVINPTDDDKNPVSVSVNGGTKLTIKRGQRVTIPVEHYQVLQDINENAIKVTPLTKGKPKNSEESPVVEYYKDIKYPMTVIRFINKGTKKDDK